MKTHLRAEEWEELIPDQSVNGAEGTRWRDTHAEPLVCTKEKVSLELLRQKGQSCHQQELSMVCQVHSSCILPPAVTPQDSASFH